MSAVRKTGASVLAAGMLALALAGCGGGAAQSGPTFASAHQIAAKLGGTQDYTAEVPMFGIQTGGNFTMGNNAVGEAATFANATQQDTFTKMSTGLGSYVVKGNLWSVSVDSPAAARWVVSQLGAGEVINP